MTAPLLLSACAPNGGRHDAAVARTWQMGTSNGLNSSALGLEPVRHATLAPSFHNTQCWKFDLQPQPVTILPDYSRRCPVIHHDDHHLFVSLGCAAENLSQAALARWDTRTRRAAWSAVRLLIAIAVGLALQVMGLGAPMLAAFAPDAAHVLGVVVVLLCLPAIAWARRSLVRHGGVGQP
jgi:hypothetical protein